MSTARQLYKEGFGHYIEERYDDAVAKYREAVAADPALAIAWNALGMALSRLGDVDGAIEAGEKLVALDPDDPLGYTNLSIYYQQKGMIPEAEDMKARAMQANLRQQGKGS